ncbi:B-cell receptor-associated protein 31 [Hyalella azteca]|nr:B-cell receptor-associated protein 31 [Hyalella azteca]
MSIQWTLIAGCMYTELALTFLLLLPIISPKRWHSFFKSRFLASIYKMSHVYFMVFLAVLVLVFLDAIREMHKYSGEIKSPTHGHAEHLDVEMQHHMRLFRAQRNFYISGISLFLLFVLHRLVSLISLLAVSYAELEAAMKQAKSASDAARQLLDQQDPTAASKDISAELTQLKEENKKMLAQKEAALKQAESVNREYDRLMKELATLQAKEEAVSEGGKKDK